MKLAYDIAFVAAATATLTFAVLLVAFGSPWFMAGFAAAFFATAVTAGGPW